MTVQFNNIVVLGTPSNQMCFCVFNPRLKLDATMPFLTSCLNSNKQTWSYCFIPLRRLFFSSIFIYLQLSADNVGLSLAVAHHHTRQLCVIEKPQVIYIHYTLQSVCGRCDRTDSPVL